MKVVTIIERDLQDGEEGVLGVASDRANALRMVYEYYGEQSTFSKVEDIRDSGIDFTMKVESSVGRYSIIGCDYLINNI